jgi:hypothetical protein
MTNRNFERKSRDSAAAGCLGCLAMFFIVTAAIVLSVAHLTVKYW